MSKIGNYNMELEEELRDQLNKPGFETLQDALNAGWEVLPLLDPVTGETSHHLQRIDDMKFFVNDSVSLTDEAYEQAHEAWLKEKEEVLAAIDRIKTSMENIYGDDFKPEVAAIALDGDPDKAFRYSEILKIKKFIEEAHD